ncbi:hypothetical protein BH11BAC7_BH11BAC7_08930 [soil metagenome]
MRYIFLFALPVFLFSCGNEKDKALPPLSENCYCVDTSDGGSLCPDIPHEIDQSLLPGTAYKSVLSPKFQPPFDLFSWQSFIALNWPANSSGVADSSTSILTDSTSLRVWEYYPLADTVFQPLGGTMKLKLQPRDPRAAKQLYQSTMFADDFIANQFFEADGSTLIDRNLNYVLYEERINQDEWQFILNNNLRTQSGQMNYVKTNGSLTLPGGTYNGVYGNSNGPVGAIEIKASWRILDTTKGDDVSRYYHQQAQITIGSQFTWSGNQLQFIATVGLVGFHIIHKTKAFGREIWSSFEHIDNVPDDLLEAHDPQHGYSFYQPVCYSCPVNTKPGVINGKMAMWNDVPPYAGAYGIVGQNNEFRDTGIFGSQILRVFPIFVTTDSLNKIFQAKLAGSVWANYKLVGTQWFKASTDAPGGPIPPNAPARLANTTLETFDQNTASCTTCHGFAYIAGGGTDSTSGPEYKSDFSFLFRKAAHSSPSALGQMAKTPVPVKK